MNKKNFSRVFRSREGSISLMAVLIMLAIAVIGLSVAFIVLGEIQASQDTANVLRASYASETALEKGLDIITEKRFQKATLASTITALRGVSGTIDATQADFAIENANAGVSEKISFDLAPQESATIDFFDADQPTSGSGIGSVVMDWSDTCNETSWVEIAALGWDTLWDNANIPKNYYYNCHHTDVPAGEPNQCKFISNIVSPQESYRLRVKNISGTQNNQDDCVIKNASLVAYDSPNAGGNPVNIPNSIALIASGVFARNTYRISATLSWTLGASGLLDYVLFSEEKITK